MLLRDGLRGRELVLGLVRVERAKRARARGGHVRSAGPRRACRAFFLARDAAAARRLRAIRWALRASCSSLATPGGKTSCSN